MILNPNRPEARHLLACIPGTRMLQETLGLIGARVSDPYNALRSWQIQGFYAPIRNRAIGGLRAKLVDNLEFTTFCNQRDLEVLLGIAEPGDWCSWLGEDYVGPLDATWIGFGTDPDDLLDDLYDRELQERSKYEQGSILPEGSQIQRRIHDGPRNDYEELVMLLWDADPQTGCGPDDRFETLDARWRSVERTMPRERLRLWQSIYQRLISVT